MPTAVNPTYSVPGGSLLGRTYVPDPSNPLAVGSIGGTPLFGANQDKPMLDPATGLYHSQKTGALWTGAVTKPDGATAKVQNGKLLPADQYGNPLPVFTPIETPKMPDIQNAASGLLKQANESAAGIPGTVAGNNEIASGLTKSFADYLAQAKGINEQSKIQLTKDQAAVDPQATIDRVNADSAQQNDELRANDRNYTGAQTKVQGDITAENTAAADTTAARLAKLKADLDSQNSQYEQSAQAVAGQAWDKARQGLSLYQLGSGTPTSGSGDLSNRAIRSYDAINIPLQQELAQRRYSQTGILDAQQQAADEERYQNLMRQYGGAAALNTDLANRTGDTARYTGNLDAATAQYIQTLKQQTAGMSRAQAAEYLRQLNVPIEVGQQVLQTQLQIENANNALIPNATRNLADIGSIEGNANYFTLSSPYDASRVPAAPVFNPVLPTRTYTPNSVPQTMTGTSPASTAPAAPVGQLVDVGGGYQRDQQGNTWLNGQLISQGQPVLPKPYVAPLPRNYTPQDLSATNVDSQNGII